MLHIDRTSVRGAIDGTDRLRAESLLADWVRRFLFTTGQQQRQVLEQVLKAAGVVGDDETKAEGENST